MKYTGFHVDTYQLRENSGKNLKVILNDENLLSYFNQLSKEQSDEFDKILFGT